MLLAPVLDRLLVALARASDRLLAAEADGFENTTDMANMIADAKGLPNKLGNAGARPDSPAKPESFGTLIEQGRQLCALGAGQARSRPSRFFATQRRAARPTSAAEPLADCTLRDTQSGGNLLLCPADLM